MPKMRAITQLVSEQRPAKQQPFFTERSSRRLEQPQPRPRSRVFQPEPQPTPQPLPRSSVFKPPPQPLPRSSVFQPELSSASASSSALTTPILPSVPTVSPRTLEDARSEILALSPSQSVSFDPASWLPNTPDVSPRTLEDAREEVNLLAPSQSISYTPLFGFPAVPSASSRTRDDLALNKPKKSYLERMYEYFVPPLTTENNLPVQAPSQNLRALNVIPSSRLSSRLTPTYELPNPFESVQPNLSYVPQPAPSGIASSSIFSEQPSASYVSQQPLSGIPTISIFSEQPSVSQQPRPSGIPSSSLILADPTPLPSSVIPGNTGGLDLSPLLPSSSSQLASIAPVPPTAAPRQIKRARALETQEK